MGSTVIESSYKDLNTGFLRDYPITSYAGGFIPATSYRKADVVLFAMQLYLVLMDTSSGMTPIGDPNFMPYSLSASNAIKITVDVAFVLSGGIYKIVLQGGGGTGAVSTAAGIGGGGGGAGYINQFDLMITNPITLNIIVGLGGQSGLNLQNDGHATLVNYTSNGYTTSLIAQGGRRGGQDGRGGDGGYGGGGGQSSDLSAGGSSQTSIGSGMAGTPSFAGNGAYSDSQVHSSTLANGGGHAGGNGGGMGSGEGGYAISLPPIFATDAKPNTGAGGGGAGITNTIPIPIQDVTPGAGGSGWVIIRRRR